MTLNIKQCENLFNKLEKSGWFWKENFIYAPGKTIWLLKDNPWQSDLYDFHNRMVKRLERIRLNNTYDDEKDYRQVYDDTAVLIDALKSIIYEEAEKPPTFEHAVYKMRYFLASQGKSEKIAWIFREDLTSYKLNIWIKLPLNYHTETAKKLYQEGLNADLGIEINQIGMTEDISLCYIRLPSDKTDMEQSMMDRNLKLCISQTEKSIRTIKNRYIWYLLKVINKFRRFNFLESELPVRKTVVNLDKESMICR